MEQLYHGLWALHGRMKVELAMANQFLLTRPRFLISPKGGAYDKIPWPGLICNQDMGMVKVGYSAYSVEDLGVSGRLEKIIDL